MESSPRKRLRSHGGKSSPEKRLLTSSEDDEMPTFVAKSFYGNKHSATPKRSPASSSPVIVLSPLTDSKIASIQANLQNVQRNSSPESEMSGYSVCRLRKRQQSTQNLSVNHRPKHEKRSLLPERKSVTKNIRGSLTPAPKKSTSENNENTPVGRNRTKSSSSSSGKKFFRTKSPASADKMLGSIIVRKGFNLKFVPKRLSGNLWSTKSTSKSAKKTKQTVKRKYPKLKMKQAKASKDAFLFESEHSSGENTDSLPLVCVNKDKVLKVRKNQKSEVKSVVKETDTCSTSSLANSSVASPRKNCVSFDKCDVSMERYADSLCPRNTSPQSTVSLISEPQSRKTASFSGSQDLFGFDSLMSDEIETSRPPSVYSDKSVTPTKEFNEEVSEETNKYFPIFDPKRKPSLDKSSPGKLRRSLRSSPRISPGFKFTKDTGGTAQMIIDAGQKKIGAIQCEICNMLYNPGDPSDETDHAKIHQAFINALSFPGWKKERVAQEFPDDGGRVIVVLSSDPKYQAKKVEEINQVMSKDLGFPEQSVWSRPYVKVFLYISDDNEVEGCVVAESVTEGYRVIPDSQGNSQIISQRTGRPWCCQTDPESAIVGISRLWVNNRCRRKGIGSRLVDTVRQVFEHGIMIDKDQVAFSDPTSDGKHFATKYCGTPAFLVYKYM